MRENVASAGTRPVVFPMNHADFNVQREVGPGTQTSEQYAPLDWPVRVGVVDDVIRGMTARVALRRRRRYLLATTAVTLALTGVGGYWLHPRRPAETVLAHGPTFVGQLNRKILADGSVVDLRPGARISVSYDSLVRRVALEQGEAHFEVVKDSARPFVVSAGDVEFRAVGTAFTVQRDVGTIELVVTEGRVALDPSFPQGAPVLGAAAPAVVVAAGTRAVITKRADAEASDLRLEALSPPEVHQRIAWRVPTLELSGTPLVEIVEAFNRYSGQRFVLGDEIAQLRLSGILRADSVDTLLSLLQERQVRAERGPTGELVLRQR